MASEQLATFLEDDIEHTSSRPNIDEKVLECAICEGRLNNPKYLSCHHTFCLKCLEDWVNRNGELLSCPTCSKSCSIPEEGLQRLPPNTSVTELLETIEQFTNADQMRCVTCGKEGHPESYCQDCREFLCLNCSGHHKNIRACKNHKLQSVEDVRSMSVKDIIATYPPLCSIHNESLSSFCKICNIPICIHCSITNHKQWEEKDKHMLHVGLSSDELKTLKETSVELEKAANKCTSKLNENLEVILDIDKKLEENKERSLQDIDNHVEEMVARIKESGETLKKEVKTIYNQKKTVTDFQIAELTTAISDINTNICLLHHLKESDGAMAISSGNSIIRALEMRIKEAPKTIPDDNVQINFVKNKQQNASLQEDIGSVIQTSETAISLELNGPECVTTDQVIEVKIIKTAECDLHEKYLEATWRKPSGKIEVDTKQCSCRYITSNNTFKGRSISAGICQVDVSVDGNYIKKSPITIKVEKVGLIKEVRISADNDNVPVDVVRDVNDCMLVSCRSNIIHRYKQSGDYVSKVTLPIDVKVNRMFKMRNGNIAFSDCGETKSIKICTIDGEVVKSIGESKVISPHGLYVNERTNIVYVCNGRHLVLFDIKSGKTISEVFIDKKVVTDLCLTERNILLLGDSCIYCCDYEGKVSKYKEFSSRSTLRGIEVDDDDNLLIASGYEVEVFKRYSGRSIKSIGKSRELTNAQGLALLSYYPRRVAVIDDNKVKIFNY
ncbi:E3 ubiquitin-protein ligase TRIM45-like [Antedon mediterranea]|uniref:E3 ubiquitin-protein ligase TRIM45-like n=1 Tax=Antedon mediterranea TaxID=105859 RepID=UPI003AF638AD